jgi:hypothetical protein
MSKFEREAHEAADTLAAYEERRQRHAAGYAPAPRAQPAGVWSPRMTEQQRAELAQHIEKHHCPF